MSQQYYRNKSSSKDRKESNAKSSDEVKVSVDLDLDLDVELEVKHSGSNIAPSDNQDIDINEHRRHHKSGGKCDCCHPKEECIWVPKYTVRKEKEMLPVKKLKKYTVIRTDYKDECYEVDVPKTITVKEKRWRKVPVKVPETHCKEITVMEPFYKKVVECKWEKKCRPLCHEESSSSSSCSKSEESHCHEEKKESCHKEHKERHSSHKEKDEWSSWGW